MKTTNKFARSFVESEVITISPQDAEIMLATMPPGGNRHLRASHVETLAGLITGGHFRVTHCGIAFDQSGRLIDGQHRLSAIIIANVPVQMMVTYGLPGEVMDAVDRGATRSVGDLLSIVHGVPGGSPLTSACRILQCEFHSVRTGQTIAGTLDIYRQYKPGLDWMLKAIPAKTGMNKSPYRAAVALAWIYLPESAQEFWDCYHSGKCVDQETSAPWRLREWTMQFNMSNKRAEEGELFRIACNALAAHLQGRPMSKISRLPDGVEFFRAAVAPKGGAS